MTEKSDKFTGRRGQKFKKSMINSIIRLQQRFRSASVDNSKNINKNFETKTGNKLNPDTVINNAHKTNKKSSFYTKNSNDDDPSKHGGKMDNFHADLDENKKNTSGQKKIFFQQPVNSKSQQFNSANEGVDVEEEKNEDVSLKLEFGYLDYIKLFLPDFLYNSRKKRLFKNGKEMINRKLDLINIIETMNELEKLKNLLFDENQHYIFELIPKPVMFDKKIIELNQKDLEELGKKIENRNFSLEDLGVDLEDEKNNKKKVRDNLILTCNGRFWMKKSERQKEHNFQQALINIKYKKNPDIIDQRLVELLDFGEN